MSCQRALFIAYSHSFVSIVKKSRELSPDQLLKSISRSSQHCFFRTFLFSGNFDLVGSDSTKRSFYRFPRQSSIAKQYLEICHKSLILSQKIHIFQLYNPTSHNSYTILRNPLSLFLDNYVIKSTHVTFIPEYFYSFHFIFSFPDNHNLRLLQTHG